MKLLDHLADVVQEKTTLGILRSANWRALRNLHIIMNPACAVCGSTKNLEAHHIIPYNVSPELELELDNLITLCESKRYGVNCHLFFGHLGNYRNYNQTVKEDTAVWGKRIGK